MTAEEAVSGIQGDVAAVVRRALAEHDFRLNEPAIQAVKDSVEAYLAALRSRGPEAIPNWKVDVKVERNNVLIRLLPPLGFIPISLDVR